MASRPHDLPVGVESALARAAADPLFREQLAQRRSAAAVEAGLVLSPAERAVLDALDPVQLDAILAGLRAPSRSGSPDAALAMTAGIRPDDSSPIRGIRPGLPIAIATAAIVGGAVYVTTLTAGVRPDLPPAPSEQPADAGTTGAPAPPQPE